MVVYEKKKHGLEIGFLAGDVEWCVALGVAELIPCDCEYEPWFSKESKDFEMVVHHGEMGSGVESVSLFAVDVNIVFLKLSFGLLDISFATETDELLFVELGGHLEVSIRIII